MKLWDTWAKDNNICSSNCHVHRAVWFVFNKSCQSWEMLCDSPDFCWEILDILLISGNFEKAVGWNWHLKLEKKYFWRNKTVTNGWTVMMIIGQGQWCNFDSKSTWSRLRLCDFQCHNLWAIDYNTIISLHLYGKAGLIT